jgi:alpha-1,2-mannosyltransferase
MTARTSPRPIPLPTAIWLVVAVIGWSMIAWLAIRLFSTNPPTAGFDLELLLRAGRDVAAGRSAYDPALLGGTAPDATGLFFSYPPLVAQAFAVVSFVPSGLALVAWSIGAIAALLAVAERLRRAIRATAPAGSVALAVLAVASLTFPFTIAVLFGNLDAFFPALYGLALVAAVSPRRTAGIAGGIAVAIAAATKLYPAGLGLWFAVRALRERRAAVTLIAAVAAGAVLVAVSLLVGGPDPWRNYITVIGAASRAELLDPDNIGVAAILARAVGGDSDFARLAQVLVTVVALAVIVLAAWRRPDPVESLAIAAAATFVLLPVTWIHYPAALIPFGVAALLRSDGAAAGRTRLLIGGAVVAAGASLAWLPLLWAAVGLVLAGVHASAAGSATDSPVEAAAQ